MPRLRDSSYKHAHILPLVGHIGFIAMLLLCSNETNMTAHATRHHTTSRVTSPVTRCAKALYPELRKNYSKNWKIN